MSLAVLVAVSGVWEPPLVSGLEVPGSAVRVARRCADLAELLSAASAGLASAAIVSADLPRLDGDALARLDRLGVAVVGLADPADPVDGARLVALGVSQVVDADTPAATIADLVVAAVDQRRARQDAPLEDPSTASGTASGAGSTGRFGVPATAGVAGLNGLPGSRSPLADPPSRRRGRAAGNAQAGAPSVPDRPTPDRPGRLVAVWGPVGAPGRTTVAVTLANELAVAGQSALLVDADTYGPSVAQVLGLLDESAGLAAAVRAALQSGLDAERLARLAPYVAPRLRVLTGLPRPGRWPELRPTGLDLVWRHARALAHWTVVDCGFALEADEEITFDSSAPRRNGATLSALAAADLVLAVGAADPVGLQRLVRGLQDLAEVLGPGRAPRVVVTRVRASVVGGSPEHRVTQALDRYAGVRDVVLVPDDRPALDAALLAGRSLTEVATGSPARRALAGLAATLAGTLVAAEAPTPAVPGRPGA